MPLAGRKKMDALRELKWEPTQFLQVFKRYRVRQLQPFNFQTLLLNVYVSDGCLPLSLQLYLQCFSAITAVIFSA